MDGGRGPLRRAGEQRQQQDAVELLHGVGVGLGLGSGLGLGLGLGLGSGSGGYRVRPLAPTLHEDEVRAVLRSYASPEDAWLTTRDGCSHKRALSMRCAHSAADMKPST